MSILVAYASRYGSTQEIAERIAETLTDHGHAAEARPVQAVIDLDRFDAFVVGSALYVGRWDKTASRFVRQHHAVLAAKPVWLFSSGPLGSSPTDSHGRDVCETAGPRELAELQSLTGARAHRVFFGALDSRTLRGAHRTIAALPGLRKLFVEGDFRDWPEIDAWAAGIAGELDTAGATRASSVASATGAAPASSVASAAGAAPAPTTPAVPAGV